MTSNDFAANLYDIEVTFVTEAYGIGSIVGPKILLKSQINDRQGHSVRPIGLDLSRSSESDPVTKRRPVLAYMRLIYTPIYIIK